MNAAPPMKRTPFKRAGTYATPAAPAAPIAKATPVRSEAYRRAVQA